MKILNIIAEARFGGPQKRILEVATGLKKKGVETIVVMPNYDADLFQSLLKERGIQFEAISIHRLTKDVSHLIKFLVFFIPELWKVRGLIKKHQPDVIHCNGAWQIKGVIAAKMTGTRCIWHLNDSFMPGSVLWLFRAIVRMFSDQFIASSIRTKEFYTAHAVSPKLPMTIVLPPVDTASFDPAIVEPESEIADTDGIKIVTVGNVNPIKGYPTFVEMVNLVNQQTTEKVNFFIVGKLLDNQKELTNQLKSRVKELGIQNLEFMGGRSNVPQLLKAADIFVCPSYSEAGPMSVFEAMAMELPVVSSDVGDVKQLFGNDEAGIIVPVKDEQAMADAVVKLVNDKTLRKKLAQNARAKAIEILDISNCTDVHHEVYQAVANGTYH